MKRFALIGAAGYVAPRHLQAIHDVGGELIAAIDPHDSVGVLDSFFPEAEFFTDFPQFERFLREGVDYISICSPNYLHNAHVQIALQFGADVICEKPLVLNLSSLTSLMKQEKLSNQHINTIMQLRLHPEIIALKQRLEGKIHNVNLTYIAPRGRWYHSSWKGDPAKSGGLITNIGIHMFDLLIWLFGDARKNIVYNRDATSASGFLDLARAHVNWLLSIEQKPAQRIIEVDGEEINLSNGFTDLHTESYWRILANQGFTTMDVLPSIQLVSAIQDAEVR